MSSKASQTSQTSEPGRAREPGQSAPQLGVYLDSAEWNLVMKCLNEFHYNVTMDKVLVQVKVQRELLNRPFKP